MATRKAAPGKSRRAGRRPASPRSRPARAAAPKEASTKRRTAPREYEGPSFVGKHIFARGKVSSKGWIVIPKAIRDEMGLRPGDDVTLALWPPSLSMKQDRGLYSLTLERVPEDPVALGLGMFKRKPGEPSLADQLVEERRRELEQEERDVPPPKKQRFTA